MGQSYLKNAALLTGADVLLRLAGMGLRIYLANALGGVFQVALPHGLPPSPAQAFGSVYAAFPGQYALL